ncbi:hypothetical protein, partial [Bradyrhizobium sp. SZCCHNRI30511]|uniref:hypothetical protein n=1 Tax=Bradyrhizobium sp. SZCCHNRI30511 TaxID=3057293 RepID=UPI002915E3A4
MRHSARLTGTVERKPCQWLGVQPASRFYLAALIGRMFCLSAAIVFVVFAIGALHLHRQKHACSAV